MNYGIPYKGSKNAIALRLLEVMPQARTFYDLFAGGCAMTHAAMLSGKYRRFVANDINPMPVQLFRDAAAGKYHDEKRVITRQEFFELKDSDPYVAYCWSFGNDGKTYLWSEVLEGFKVRACRMIMGDTWQERLKWYRSMIQYWRECMDELSLQRFEELQGFEGLQRLQRLQRLERLERLETSSLSYEEVDTDADSVIYCDIPYKGTGEYDEGGFDYERFYNWVRGQDRVIYISEYRMPDDFTTILEIPKTCHLSPTDNKVKTTERLFVHKSQINKIRKTTLF